MQINPSMSLMLHLDEGISETIEIRLPDLEEQSKSDAVYARSLSCEWQVGREAKHLHLQLSLQNMGEKPIFLQSVRLSGNLIEQNHDPAWRVFIDAGECAWCGVKNLDALEVSPAFDVIAQQRIKEPTQRSNRFHRSSLQTVIYDANSEYNLLIGFLGQNCGYNGVDVIPDIETTSILDRFELWQLSETKLLSGEELVLDPIVILEGKDPLQGLESFAALVQAHHGKSFEEPPVAGMMTWYGYRTAIDENIILENAALISELFSGYPQPMQKMMLLDHGWQPDANWGYWDQADPERFPKGMKWLGEQLRSIGLELGLWYTPFCVTENYPELETRRPLLALDEDGNPHLSYACVWGQLPGHSAGNWPIYFFDGSLDQVQQKWLRELQHMADEWGCVYWKLDFFALIAGDQRKADFPASRLYSQTYDYFREAIGNGGHLAPCSCDTNIQLGRNDSIRIAADIGNAGTWPKEMPQYKRGLTTVAANWYKHRRFWINDADSIQIGCGCSLNEARVRATMVAFSGGHLMVSEDLRWMSPDRIEILRRLLPAYGIAAKPLDLFEHVYPDDYPRIWQLPVESDWGARDTLAIFNLSESWQRLFVEPEWLGIRNGETFGVFEWWQQQWLGKHHTQFEVFVPPADVILLHAQTYRDHPWMISTSHHFTGGWIVENLQFDPYLEQLTGDLVTKSRLAVSLMGTMPDGWGIPPSADFHGRGNGSGGWTYEVRTTSTRTHFGIQFEKSAN